MKRIKLSPSENVHGGTALFHVYRYFMLPLSLLMALGYNDESCVQLGIDHLVELICGNLK